MLDNYCPECLRRQDRLYAGLPLSSDFKAGRLVNGQCNRCSYTQPSLLEDTSEFAWPPTIAADVEAVSPETHDSIAAAS